MEIFKVFCPHCQAVLRSGKPLPPGRSVTCLKCQKNFTIAEKEPPTEQLHASAIQVPATLAQEEDTQVLPPAPGPVELVSSPVSPPPRPPGEGGSQRGILILLSALGAFLLLGGGLSLYLILPGAEPKPVVASPTPPEEAEISLPKPKEEMVQEPGKKDNDSQPLPKNPETKLPAPAPKPATTVPVTAKKTKEEDGGSLFSFNTSNVTPGVTPRRVEQALEKGVKFLQSSQGKSGSWLPGKGQHAVGYASLPALTLLECKVPGQDPVMQKAAEFVRNNTAKLSDTYDLGLAVLFLDRLGETRDEPLLQTLALRLVAGQTPAGGWDYHCPLLNPEEAQILLNYLRTNRPGDKRPPQAGKLPEKLQNLPVVINVGKGKGQTTLGKSKDDNSNSQFAMLAIWTARRHGVPTEATLRLANQRFETSQNKDGGWGYTFRGPTKDTMTCVGLLGLAMGHGAELNPANKKAPAGNKVAIEDTGIQKGLKTLGKYIGIPSENSTPPMDNLYLLWSVERVAMLYNLKTIGTRDWYAWGAQIILGHQKEEGSWSSQKYHGSAPVIDTCFALLFLRRSNLVQDLTDNLGLILAINDPDVIPPPRNKKQ